MAINVTWDGTTYSIPQSGEFNWSSLTNFLVALGNKAAVAGEMKQEIRKATTSPVTVSAASDYAVVTDLTVAGPVTVNLPGGSPGQIFVIVDGKADAATNNITINRSGSDTIIGQTSLVLNKNRQVVMLQYNSGDSDWKVINYAIPPGQVTDSDISGVISTAGKVSGSAITSGTIAGSTSLNSSGSVTLTGSGALSVAGTAALNGGVTLGDQAADALTINSSAASIPNGLNFDANTFVIDATLNRVGIGTASPSQALDVVGTVNATTVAAATVNAGALNASGNTALGDASSDVLTINGTAVTIPNGLNIDSNTLVVDAANNRVGVGVASPATRVEAAGVVHVHDSGTVPDNTYVSGVIRSTRPAASGEHINITRADNINWAIGTIYNTNTFAIGQSAAGTDANFTNPALALSQSGNLGIGIYDPSDRLEVDGSATAVRFNVIGTAGAGFVELTEQSSSPSTPSSGFTRLYSKTDNKLYYKDDAGIETQVGSGGTLDVIAQASHGFVTADIGKAVYLNGGVYALALASASTTAEVVGVISRIVDTNSFEIILAGEITGLTGLTAGAVYFLSPSSPGVLTTVEPTTVGHVSIPVGVASSTTSLYVAPKRGVVVGGANARTQISLANNTASQTVQNVASYDAGELAGWVYIDATTDYRFYVQAQFVKGGNTNYNISYQVSGDTPPAGFSLSITNAGVIQATMPNVAGFVSASINYALNAPAVGTNFPLSVDASAIASGTITAARLPQVSSASQGAFPSLTSSLDNATATQLGLKQYYHGTSYNGGNAPTVTCAQAGFSCVRGLFIPYQVQDGTWRLKFSISGIFTSATLTSITYSVNGITTKNSTQWFQPITMLVYNSTTIGKQFAELNSNQLKGEFTSAAMAGIGFAGDIELESKPTWAY